jgi:uncharacterized protein YndB with AHSA1/START domain
MVHIRVRQHIEAPIEHVWELAADCSRIPEWSVGFVEVRDCPDRIDQIGARYTTVGRVLGRHIIGSWETTRADRPHFFERQGVARTGDRATIAVTLIEADGGTDSTYEFQYQLPGGMFSGVAEGLAAAAIERDLRHANENFKALCEAPVAALAQS